jgi:hypothetical protein
MGLIVLLGCEVGQERKRGGADDQQDRYTNGSQ